MIVADSSYLAEGILADEALLKTERILTPDLAIYETLSVIWKHEAVLGELTNGRRFIEILFEFVGSNFIIPVSPDRELAERAHALAVLHQAHPNDMVFVALALGTGLELRTFDGAQRKIMEKETRESHA